MKNSRHFKIKLLKTIKESYIFLVFFDCVFRFCFDILCFTQSAHELLILFNDWRSFDSTIASYSCTRMWNSEIKSFKNFKIKTTTMKNWSNFDNFTIQFLKSKKKIHRERLIFVICSWSKTWNTFYERINSIRHAALMIFIWLTSMNSRFDKHIVSMHANVKHRDNIVLSKNAKKDERWWIVAVERRRLFDRNLQNIEHRIHMHAFFSNFFDEVEYHQKHRKANHIQNLSFQLKKRKNSLISINLFEDDRKFFYRLTKSSIAISKLRHQEEVQCWKRIQYVNMIKWKNVIFITLFCLEL